MTPALDRFIIVPENPIPDAGSVRIITAADGVGLRFAQWQPATAQAGTVLILPGRSEFIEKYFETIGELIARGFAVAALDWRGQGGSERALSDPHKGHIDHFALYRRDLDAALTEMAATNCPRPWFGLAHSMGGAIVIDSVAQGERRLERAILSAPMIGIHNASPGGIGALAARALNLFGLGGLYLPGGSERSPSAFDPFEGNALSSDAVRYQRTAAVLIAGPDLALGAPTIAWAAAAFRLLRQMLRPDFGLTIRCPLLFVTAGDETIVSTPASEALAIRIRGARAINIPGARHEILMERDVFRQQFWAAFDSYIP